jgi:hypothetical protein
VIGLRVKHVECVMAFALCDGVRAVGELQSTRLRGFGCRLDIIGLTVRQRTRRGKHTLGSFSNHSNSSPRRTK